MKGAGQEMRSRYDPSQVREELVHMVELMATGRFGWGKGEKCEKCDTFDDAEVSRATLPFSSLISNLSIDRQTLPGVSKTANAPKNGDSDR